MATKSNELPIKVYRKMLVNNYKENQKDAAKIKNCLSKNQDPICQKEDRYIPPKPRGNILTEAYIKKMADKPEKKHIKHIPLKTSLTSGLLVGREEKKKEGIYINPNIQRNKDSFNTDENYKHLKTYKHGNTLKNFYFDNFNSVKQNQNDLAKLRASVSKKLFYL